MRKGRYFAIYWRSDGAGSKNKLPLDIAYIAEQGIFEISKDLISITANACEPLPEKYFGSHVILELIPDGGEVEYFGILKEYSGEFIELPDINYRD